MPRERQLKKSWITWFHSHFPDKDKTLVLCARNPRKCPLRVTRIWVRKTKTFVCVHRKTIASCVCVCLCTCGRSGHDELFYKYRPVPRGLWRSYDAKAENERSAPEERFLGQSNTKGGARNLGMFPSPRYHSPSLKLLGRQRCAIRCSLLPSSFSLCLHKEISSRPICSVLSR